LAALSRPLGVSIDYLVDGGRSPQTMLEHSAFRYRTDDQLRTTMGSFLAEGIERSEAILAATTATNIELLREQLGNDARNVQFVDGASFYTTPIAALEAIRSFSDTELAGDAPWVRILGEPAWAGRSEVEVRQWTRYESLLNLVFGAYPLTIVCPYDERTLAPDIVREAHFTHPHMTCDQGISESPEYVDARRFALSD
jgi:hypothetical protein